MFVFRFLILRFLQHPVLISFFPGRDYNYQTLNLTFAVNVIKFGLIISMFPRPLKPCVSSIHIKIYISFSLKPTSVLCHACYRTFPPRFDRKLNSSDLLLRSDLQSWRNMERTGMIGRSVGRCIQVCYLSHYADNSQNDMLMWLMSEAKGVERSVEGVARRLLLVNFAAIHTTSLASHGLQTPVMPSYS